MKNKKIGDYLEQNKSATLKCLFGMAKQSKKNNKDIIGMPCICDKDENIKLSPKDKMEIWKDYEENEWSGQLNVEKQTKGHIKVSVKRSSYGSTNLMKTGKAAGLSGITSDLLKCIKMRVSRS